MPCARSCRPQFRDPRQLAGAEVRERRAEPATRQVSCVEPGRPTHGAEVEEPLERIEGRRDTAAAASETVVPPALSPAEWHAVIQREEQLLALRESIVDSPFSAHALAALFLFQQPFGFTAADVSDEREVADYCDAMAARHATEGDERTAASFRDLAARHRQRAAKIAALLPPDGAA